MPNDIDPEVMKKAVKEALKEWLNEKMSDFGLFSLKWFGAAALAAIVYLWFTSHGWKL